MFVRNVSSRKFSGKLTKQIRVIIQSYQWCQPHTELSNLFVCFLWRCGPTRAMTSSFTRFLDHTQRRTTVGRTPLDE